MLLVIDLYIHSNRNSLDVCSDTKIIELNGGESVPQSGKVGSRSATTLRLCETGILPVRRTRRRMPGQQRSRIVEPKEATLLIRTDATRSFAARTCDETARCRSAAGSGCARRRAVRATSMTGARPIARQPARTHFLGQARSASGRSSPIVPVSMETPPNVPVTFRSASGGPVTPATVPHGSPVA